MGLEGFEVKNMIVCLRGIIENTTFRFGHDTL